MNPPPQKEIWRVIGMMSGTSLDGVDIAYIEFRWDAVLNYKILQAETHVYLPKWKKKLKNAFYSSAQEITKLDVTYGKYLGELVNNFIDKHKITDIDFVASHGHTVFHNPTEKYTLQIGDGATLAHTCKQNVVTDFRTQDVAMGGQGAPLVPIGDRLLFSEYDYCINIGGFANISFEENTERRAFDICPANIILNHYSQKIGLDFDFKGNTARTGHLSNDLLNVLNNMPLYQHKKSMGVEIVLSDFIPLIDSFSLDINDILRTYVEHIALRITAPLKLHTKSLLTGGGAFNGFLIERLKQYSKSEIILPNPQLIHYKEALVFGLMGLLRMKNKINCLASVTGCYKNHSSGTIFIP